MEGPLQGLFWAFLWRVKSSYVTTRRLYATLSGLTRVCSWSSGCTSYQRCRSFSGRVAITCPPSALEKLSIRVRVRSELRRTIPTTDTYLRGVSTAYKYVQFTYRPEAGRTILPPRARVWVKTRKPGPTQSARTCRSATYARRLSTRHCSAQRSMGTQPCAAYKHAPACATGWAMYAHAGACAVGKHGSASSLTLHNSATH